MTAGRATIERLNTGVPGLDEVLGGGLPEFSFNILAGPPGCGKTTLAHQAMFALASEARPALYFTVLGEPPLKMLRYMQQFDFFDASKVGRSVHFINLADDTVTGDLDKVLARIAAAVEAHAPALVFVDSFRSVMLASQGGGHSFLSLQQFVQQLGMLMTSWQATSFLIGEYFAEADPSPVFTVADGLLWLRQSTQGNSVVRKLEVTKMRGQASLPGLHTFRIGSAGITVFPPARAGLAPLPAAGARLAMGVPGLDALMGGGLPRGHSLLVSGPSGSGKTVLASAFLAEGARRGETAVVAAFEPRPGLARAPGMAELIAGGQVAVVDTRGANLSVDEIASLLVAEIARVGASRVVIDSLSGFELTLAPTFRDDFREALARMVAALAGIGATLLMTSELEDRYDDLRFSPYGTAFLTDAIVVQRYVEVDSRLLRMLAVVKLRGSAHSNELREFSIGDDGIRIGARLAGFDGLLGGRPQRRKRLQGDPAGGAGGQ
ncbi:ATPase domain-containing protein [Derxia lacustris]|uniref:ATPase domain-containing protein n=1 Tax=Derxia lacustris TaxID=764842 RepID=UPI000A170A2D|nr:ATPase domain-containing protein [Derxia lacustris]